MSVNEQTQEPAWSFLTFSCVSVTVPFVRFKVSFAKKKLLQQVYRLSVIERQGREKPECWPNSVTFLIENSWARTWHILRTDSSSTHATTTTQHFRWNDGQLGRTWVFLQVLGVQPIFLFLLRGCWQEAGGLVVCTGSWLAHGSVGRRNLAFSRLFSHPHSRNLVREGVDCYSMISVQNMKRPQWKAKEKWGLCYFPDIFTLMQTGF